MSWFSAKAFLLGFASAFVAIGAVAWLGRFHIVNMFSGLTGFTAERGAVETRTRFALVQDGVRVGVLEKGARLELSGNTDKMTRFAVEMAWPETGPRDDRFAPTQRTAFLELQEETDK